MLVGFLCFILPIIFFSGINNNTAVFILLTSAVFFAYVTYKWEFYDVWTGVLLAIILGFPLHYFRVRKS
jgi:hypothetical protein